jgi:hypothetical protein
VTFDTKNPKKYTLLLDLDETLIKEGMKIEEVLTMNDHKKMVKIHFAVRPFVKEFFEKVS